MIVLPVQMKIKCVNYTAEHSSYSTDCFFFAKPSFTGSVAVQTDLTWPKQLPTLYLSAIQPNCENVSSTQTVVHPETAAGKTHTHQQLI